MPLTRPPLPPHPARPARPRRQPGLHCRCRTSSALSPFLSTNGAMPSQRPPSPVNESSIWRPWLLNSSQGELECWPWQPKSSRRAPLAVGQRTTGGCRGGEGELGRVGILAGFSLFDRVRQDSMAPPTPSSHAARLESTACSTRRRALDGVRAPGVEEDGRHGLPLERPPCPPHRAFARR